MIDNSLLKNDERAIYTLRKIYKSYGYLPFKMSKFEEYDFYMKNKSFLISDAVITFNDNKGKLMALKPDVTLSIIKNAKFEPGNKQKVYYNENVYRISQKTRQFKEIMQTGIECIGDLDCFDIGEVVYLAAKSLASISDNFVLDISHMGILSDILHSENVSDEFAKKISKTIAEKNIHEAMTLCQMYGLSKSCTDKIIKLIQIRGDFLGVIRELKEMKLGEEGITAINSIVALSDILSSSEYFGKIRIDFSVINDMNYYNGIVFQGFVEGISESVLSGGEYGTLMRKMDKPCDAIGFAIYADLLEALEKSNQTTDVDVLLIYDKNIKAERLISEKNKIIASDKSVWCVTQIPHNVRFESIVDLREE